MSHHLEHLTRDLADSNRYTIRRGDREWSITQAHLRAPAIYYEVMTGIFGSIPDAMPSQSSWLHLLLEAGLV
jgi:hypothetical protein